MVVALRRSAPALLLVAGILTLLGFEWWRSYRAAQEDAERNIENLVRVLSEQTERTIQAIDANLQGTATELAGTPGLVDNDPVFLTNLRRRLRSLPYARALYVVGADGFISQDTDYPATPRVSLADRSYFLAHKNNPSLGLHINVPLKSRSLGVWFVALSRRINHPDGSFAGIVVAAMEPLYFEQFYRQLWVGNGTIALLLDDGTLLARSPHSEAVIGASFAHAKPFDRSLDRGRQDALWDRSPIDNIERLCGYRALESVPLVMLVTMNAAEVMRPWRSHMTVTGVGAAILLAMLAGIDMLTRRHQLREERARVRLAEAERLESIGRFAAGVAHDVGNLLRIVRSAVMLLRPQAADEAKAGSLLDQIDATLTVGGELVTQLLSYARTGGRTPEINDLNSLVFETLPMLRRAVGPRVELHASLAPFAVTCRVDRAQFHAVLLNLVLNARDAMPEGGAISLAIRLVDRDENGTWHWGEISVSDEGAGMPEEVLKQALDPFFTTKEAGHGSGLGLSQVQMFIGHSQGKLEIFSEEGKGTTIQLRLPLVDDRAGKEATST